MTDDVDEAIAAWWQAFHAARRAAHRLDDLDDRFTVITRIMNTAREMARTAAADRPQVARDIRDRDALSLAGLAERIRVSKPRAQQLVARTEGDGNEQ